MSEKGIKMLQHFECLHDGDPGTPLLQPVKDCRGIPTLGWGSIFDANGKRVTMETPAITEEEADDLLKRDLLRAAASVEKLITVPLTQWQTDALIDFVYNLGSGTLLSSRLRALLNDGQYDEVPAQIRRFVYAGGVKFKGLVRRREAEVALWLN
jgi:lysozyme